MNISIKGTHIELTPAIKEFVDDKIGNFQKYIQADEAKVELSRDQHHQSGQVFRAEVMLFIGGKLMRADATAEDLFAAIDLVIPKLKEQIAKFKDKRQDLTRRGARAAKRKN